MTTALQKRQNDAPAIFGSREEIDSIAQRMKVMLPSAHLKDWQLAPKYRETAERNLNESLYRAAQLSVFYRLVPGEDVHLIPFGNSWAVDMGIETWKKAADRYCAQHNITYHLHTEELSPEAVKERRGNDYDPEDVGFVAYLWRSDKAGVYEIFGAKEAMTKGYGTWAVKARYNQNKNQWEADTIPAQRTKYDVARRRAMKMALKAEFSLDALLAANPGEVEENRRDLEAELDHIEHEAQVLKPKRETELDESGLFAVEHPRDNGQAEVEPDMDDMDLDPPVDDGDYEEGSFTAQPLTYADLVYELEGNARKVATWTRRLQGESQRPASPRAYEYLAGVIDRHCDHDGAHNAVLEVLAGQPVDGDQRPGNQVVSKLLDLLIEERTEKMEDGSKRKVANQFYDPATVAAVQGIWRMANEVASVLEAA